jgi:hypothetical protein
MLGVLVALAAPAVAYAHTERPATFPDPAKASVPAVRTAGPVLVVCKPDSRARILKLPAKDRARNLRLLAQCRYRHVQEAVNAAASGTRLLLLPGVYREEPSREAPYPDPACDKLVVTSASGEQLVPGYLYQLRCPNAQNLIAIVGDTDGDGVCDARCGLQIEGTGSRPHDVLIDGDRRKLNVIRGDRADGLILRNFTVQYSDFNNIYVIETNGFRFERVVSRWSHEYGFLSFVSDHGLYNHVVAYGNGDSGIYAGSGPEGHCARYGIEVRVSEAWGNATGYSGTAGNGVWVHDSSFHHNATGLATDSAFPGHPGMPQDCARFERNKIYANNINPYTGSRGKYCRRPTTERDPRILCPVLLFPVGTGMLIVGGNDNLFRANAVWDNWRAGVKLHWVPAFQRGETNPDLAYDTSNGNRFTGNRMGIAPDGRRAPNGLDFWWDEEGRGNCWSDNGTVHSDPKVLPSCPNGSTFHPAAEAKFAELVRCGDWRPEKPVAPGCTWQRTPPRPRVR